MSNEDSLAKALGVTPFTEVTEIVSPPAVVEDDTQAQEYAKSQIKSAIEDGQVALGELIGIASSSQHPRAYEVVATLLTAVTNASEKLAAIDFKQKEYIHKSKGPQQGPGVVNNNLFVGNAAELLKALKSAQKSSEE